MLGSWEPLPLHRCHVQLKILRTHGDFQFCITILLHIQFHPTWFALPLVLTFCCDSEASTMPQNKSDSSKKKRKHSSGDGLDAGAPADTNAAPAQQPQVRFQLDERPAKRRG